MNTLLPESTETPSYAVEGKRVEDPSKTGLSDELWRSVDRIGSP